MEPNNKKEILITEEQVEETTQKISELFKNKENIKVTQDAKGAVFFTHKDEILTLTLLEIQALEVFINTVRVMYNG